MKKIISVLSIIVLIFTTEVNINAESMYSYNNEEEVTRISDINGKGWYIPWSARKFASSHPYNIDNIAKNVGVEPYWRLGKNGRYYGIYKIEDKGTHYLILTFGGYKFQDGWYVSKIPSKDIFDKYVKTGVSLEVVKLIDPDTFNLWEGSSRENELCESYHRFKDGMDASVYYQKDANGKWIVDTVRYRPDDIHVVENLIDKDYQLIKNDNPNEEAEFLEKLKKLEETTSNTTQTDIKKPLKGKIKSAKHVKKTKILVKLKKVKNAKKYQIQYAINKKFKKAKIKTTKKYSYTIKKLSKNKTYYIRVRGVNGTKKGTWSNIKKVKPKK